MKKLILLLLIISCSRVNEDSKIYYQQSVLRHGVVPKEVIDLKPAPTKVISRRAKRGQAIYETHCLGCHGAQGVGNGPDAKGYSPTPRNLVHLIKTVPRFKFYMMVSQYSGKMPGWKSVLSEEELTNLEHYIRSLAEK